MEQNQSMELLELEQQVTNLDIKVSGVDRKMDSVLHLLAGSEYDRDSGMVKKVQNHEERIEEIERIMTSNALVSKIQDHETRITNHDKLVTLMRGTIIGLGIPATIGILEIGKRLIQLFNK